MPQHKGSPITWFGRTAVPGPNRNTDDSRTLGQNVSESNGNTLKQNVTTMDHILLQRSKFERR